MQESVNGRQSRMTKQLGKMFSFLVSSSRSSKLICFSDMDGDADLKLLEMGYIVPRIDLGGSLEKAFDALNDNQLSWRMGRKNS